MRTQGNKLALVLKNGTLRNVKVEELFNEIENSSGTYLKSKKERAIHVQKQIMQGNSCWEFEPYSDDHEVCKTRQFSNNPFTLVNYIYNELNSI